MGLNHYGLPSNLVRRWIRMLFNYGLSVNVVESLWVEGGAVYFCNFDCHFKTCVCHHDSWECVVSGLSKSLWIVLKVSQKMD